MDVAYISALSALAGSVVGGLTSGFTTWLSQRAQAKAGQLALNLSRREELFKDFIIAASKAYGEAIVSNEPQLQEIISLYAMISRMRVLCLPPTVACADQIMVTTIGKYFEPNRTIRDLHELMKSGTEMDPLREFSEAAREELGGFTSP
ncbi:MAG TPA: hypothetical protein VFE41_12450 [Acetobacteraceae bacterium]|jgi:hypothetical protein|nr:hypothetical protein [Acetobacteraceae bacterium]